MAYYSEKKNETDQKYKHLHQKQISLSYKRDEYDSVIGPAINNAGLSVATFIKGSISNRIQCEKLIRPAIEKIEFDTPQSQEDYISDFIIEAVKEKVEKNFNTDVLMEEYLTKYDPRQPVTIGFNIPEVYRYAKSINKAISELTNKEIKKVSMNVKWKIRGFVMKPLIFMLIFQTKCKNSVSQTKCNDICI